MKYRKLLILVLFGYCSCKKSDPAIDPPLAPQGPADFTIIIPDNRFYSPDSYFILFHGTDGKLLKTISYQQGDTIRYYAPADRKGQQVIISWLNISSVNAKKLLTATTFLSNALQQTWSAMQSAPPIDLGTLLGTPNGNFGLTFNFDTPAAMVASTRFGPYYTNTGVGNPPDYDYKFPGGLYKNLPGYFFYVQYPNEDPEYAVVNNVQDKGEYSFAPPDFRVFDHFLDVKLAGDGSISGYINAVHPDQPVEQGEVLFDSQILGSIGMPNYNQQLRIGYLDSFQVYRTNIQATLENSWQTYTRIGDRPTGINLPFPEQVIVNNPGFDQFRYTVNGTYNKWVGRWEYRDNPDDTKLDVTWSVYGPSASNLPKLEMPADWSQRLPGFSLNLLVNSSIQVDVEGPGYNADIDTWFKAVPASQLIPYTIRRIQPR